MDVDSRPLLSRSSTQFASSTEDHDKEEEPTFDERPRRAPVRFSRWRRRLEIIAFVASLSLNVLFLASATLGTHLARSLSLAENPNGITEPYSPAQHVIKYELRTFAKLGALSKYHGPPTDETDEAWNSLYPVGMSRISKEEASRIANWTERIPGDDHYVVQLDAWHQIHCLNLIRKALLPERYGPSRLFDSVLENDDTPFDHVDHCVNILRENIVCNADTTPNVFQWNEDKQMMFPHFDSVHMCRDWDAVKEWTHERQLLAPFQDKVRPSRLDD